jgi:hypothetical protein
MASAAPSGIGVFAGAGSTRVGHTVYSCWTVKLGYSSHLAPHDIGLPAIAALRIVAHRRIWPLASFGTESRSNWPTVRNPTQSRDAHRLAFDTLPMTIESDDSAETVAGGGGHCGIPLVTACRSHPTPLERGVCARRLSRPPRADPPSPFATDGSPSPGLRSSFAQPTHRRPVLRS